MEKQLSTQVHSLRDDFKEKSISTNQHMTRLETLQAEVRHYGMWIILFAVSHDTKIYIYFKICSPLFSFLKLWFVSCTKQQGLEVSGHEALPLFCMLVLWCDDLIVRCEMLLDHISIALCHVWASNQLHKVNAGLFSNSSVKDGRVIGSWRLCCDSAGQTESAWVSQAVITGHTLMSLVCNNLKTKLPSHLN